MYFFNRIILLTVVLTWSYCIIVSADHSQAQDDASTGKQEKDECIFCGAEHDPICASNGRTYENPCLLKCAQNAVPSIRGLCKGECPCCKEPYDEEPTMPPGWGWERWGPPPPLGIFGPPYLPMEEEEMEAIHPEVNETMSVGTGLGCICTLQYDPVCGTDGNTYGNVCALNCERRRKPCLAVACKGGCPCCSCKK